MKSYWSRTNRREEAEGGEDNEGKRWGEGGTSFRCAERTRRSSVEGGNVIL